jgi:hypothetical protein
MSGTHLKSNGWRGRLQSKSAPVGSNLWGRGGRRGEHIGGAMVSTQSKSAPVGSNLWNCENCLDVSSRSSAIVATCGEEGRRAPW